MERKLALMRRLVSVTNEALEISQELLESIAGDEMNRIDQTVAVLREHGTMTATGVGMLLGVSKEVAYGFLTRGEETGRIERCGIIAGTKKPHILWRAI